MTRFLIAILACGGLLLAACSESGCAPPDATRVPLQAAQSLLAPLDARATVHGDAGVYSDSRTIALVGTGEAVVELTWHGTPLVAVCRGRLCDSGADQLAVSGEAYYRVLIAADDSWLRLVPISCAEAAFDLPALVCPMGAAGAAALPPASPRIDLIPPPPPTQR